MLLVAVGFVTLLIGVLSDDPLPLTYVSIGACLLAAVFLAVGVRANRPQRKPILGAGGQGAASWSGASSWSGAERRAQAEAAAREQPVEVAPEASASESSSVEDATDDSQWARPDQPPDDDTDAQPRQLDHPGAQRRASEAEEGRGVGESRRVDHPGARRRPSEFEAELSGVAGVGPSRRLLLQERFGTVERLRQASLEELAGVPGISPALAARIHDALNREV